MKYIIINHLDIETPILFPEILTHDKVASGYPGLVVSAGFCEPDAGARGVWKAHGRSTSLGLRSRPQDASIIELFLA